MFNYDNFILFLSFLKLCWPIFPKSKAKVMASVLHTLLVEWYASSSHTITEQLLISIIAAISRIIEKKIGWTGPLQII